MHLGLIDKPLVSHNLISAQESPVPYQISRWHTDLKSKCPMSPRKNPDILSFLSKSWQANPLHVSHLGLYGERCPSPKPFFTYVPGSPVKEPSPEALSLLKEKCSIPRTTLIHLAKSLVDEPPSRYLSGAPMTIDTRLQSLFYLSFSVPNKEALPPGSHHRAPIQRDAPSPEPLSAIS